MSGMQDVKASVREDDLSSSSFQLMNAVCNLLERPYHPTMIASRCAPSLAPTCSRGLLASIEDSALAPKHDLGTFLIDPPTPYTHYLPPDVPKGKVLAVHGLDVSREVMSFISAGLADG